LLLAASGYMAIVKEINDNAVLAIFIAVLFLVANFFVYIGMSKPMQDERLRKIGTTAATYSWYFTIVVMGFFIFSGYYGGRQFTAAEMFGLFTFLLVGSWLAVNTYLKWKGDAE
jgi:small-conductance mechanosensitive channel